MDFPPDKKQGSQSGEGSDSSDVKPLDAPTSDNTTGTSVASSATSAELEASNTNEPATAPEAHTVEQKPEMVDPDADLPFSTTLEQRYFDPLLECLVMLTQIKNRPFSAESLSAGLPIADKMTPELFIRAAARAGLKSKLLKRELPSLSNALLPAVLILKEGEAVILLRKLADHKYLIVVPEAGIGEQEIEEADLLEDYTGYALFVQREFDFEKRAEEEQLTPRKPNWFWGTLWSFKNYYSQVMLASILVNMFALASPFFIMAVYDRVVPNNAIATLWVLTIGIMIVIGFDFIMRTLRAFLIDLAGKKIDSVLASTLFEQVLGIRMSSQAQSAGVRASHIRDFENIRDFFTSASLTALVDLPFVILFLLVIWFIGGVLVFVPLLAIPLVVATAWLLSIPMNKEVARSFVGGAQKNAIVIEALHNLEVVKSSTAEGPLLRRWEQYVGITAKAGMASRFYSTLALNICATVTYLVTIIIVLFGVYLIGAKELSVGALVACTLIVGRVMAPLSQVTALLTRFELTKCSLKALNDVMESPLDRPHKQQFLHRSKFEGDIEFEDVSFRYPGQPISLYQNLSFKLKAGEKVGIIGSMGAGKTTLVKLLLGFFQPISGSIRIDGTDISQIDPADLRRYIGYVGQEPKLFFGTVRENIAMKAPWADDAEILRCAKLAGVDRFVSRHPAGYDMPIGESAKGISGGQAQAITVARALLNNPSLLLFDEPTSCMDNSAENVFLSNMRSYAKDKTVLLVTHKMSMLSLVDRLIVLQNGKIVADGPKEQVLDALRHLNKDAGKASTQEGH